MSLLARLALASALLLVPAAAQQPPPAGRPGVEQPSGASPPRPTAPAPSPREATQAHTVELPGRTLKFRTQTGVIVLEDERGNPEAEIGYVAYLLDGDTPAVRRPLTFAINGGPGSASAWLHLGLAGPWRLAMTPEAAAPSAPPTPIPNAETFLDFTDLVFVDPVGTGYARLLAQGDEARRKYWSVSGDIDALSDFIRRFVAEKGRAASPVVILGESYAGLRGPALATRLANRDGVGVAGLLLVSPVLDFGTRIAYTNPLEWVASLPSIVATAREAKGPIDRAAMADVEAYATGDYLADLMRGEGDAAARARLADRIAGLTGIDRAFLARLGGRLDRFTFRREFDRANGRVSSAYDGSVTGFDPYPFSANSRYSDPFTAAMAAPLTSAMVGLYRDKFGWTVPRRYVASSGAVNQAWQWGRGLSAPEVVSDLRQALALDPRLTVIIGHGLTDLVTPYFQTKLILDQFPVIGAVDRLALVVLPGGHMFYSRDGSRAAFRERAAALYARILTGR